MCLTENVLPALMSGNTMSNFKDNHNSPQLTKAQAQGERPNKMCVSGCPTDPIFLALTLFVFTADSAIVSLTMVTMGFD
jgi:hypothetical protein